MARPRLEIDPAQVEKLAELHCTVEDIAEVLGCSTDTLHRRFAGEIRKGKAASRNRLRDLQWRGAEKGNPTMLIWLGKILLNQKDPDKNDVSDKPETIIVRLDGGASDIMGTRTAVDLTVKDQKKS